MVKSTISKNTTSKEFSKFGATKIATGTCGTKRVVNGLVLGSYTHLASGICSDIKIKNKELDNIIVFAKQKEVA